MPNRVPLILTPTPLHRLDRASDALGIDLWIKRDDLTGFALGGNKGRKLEYLVAEAVESGAEVVVSCGSAQSNFIRQLAVACRMVGLRCVAAVMELPFEDERPAEPALLPHNANVFLGNLAGIEMHRYPDAPWETLYAHAEDLALQLEAEGKRVYRIPVGGSSPLGAYAFAQAGAELQAQLDGVDEILFASSSGSTHVGLAYAYAGSRTVVRGIACDPEPEIVHDFANLAAGLDALTGRGIRLAPHDFVLEGGFVGPGYGIPSVEGQDALRWLAHTEGIFLDPIYSAKAFAAVLELAKAGSLRGRVVFWHTGGVPALFALPEAAVPTRLRGPLA